MDFKNEILQGIPNYLPENNKYNINISHAPIRKQILSKDEKKLALKNALRYFDKKFHSELSIEFLGELNKYGRIYMYRYIPNYVIEARDIEEYPHKSKQAAAIMLMINNNLDYKIAQHPQELITYGGNGAVFQNWAQYLLAMKYLAEMTDDQTLTIYSGHPMGLFPSHKNAPRVVITNGMVIPNYSKQDHWEKFNALGVSQYGQMTAGSYMYIGPQGIVHGTTISLMNAFRLKGINDVRGKIFLTSGLGGMSGAQPKAGNITGCITICAEVNNDAVIKRHSQSWVDIIIDDLDILVKKVIEAQKSKEVISIAYKGNVIDVWQKLLDEDIFVDIGSDQTSLHNPWSGGYYPQGISYEDANYMISQNPDKFKQLVKESLVKHADLIIKHSKKGTYFFDYGNAFLLEASRAGAEIKKENSDDFIFPSYVQDIMGPICFDYGFGPFRWVCTSGKQEDLDKTDEIAATVLEKLYLSATDDIKLQIKDNIEWIKSAKSNNLVVGSKARILYADSDGRIEIAREFNRAIAKGEIGMIVLGRDHHDVSGTDSPYRETSNIYDGSRYTADMAIHNVIGDSFRGATWVSIHNGGGVGWGEVINGGFGMLLDGSQECEKNIEMMLFWDVNNGISRRSWARNQGSIDSMNRAMTKNPNLKITLPNIADDQIIDRLLN